MQSVLSLVSVQTNRVYTNNAQSEENYEEKISNKSDIGGTYNPKQECNSNSSTSPRQEFRTNTLPPLPKEISQNGQA